MNFVIVTPVYEDADCFQKLLQDIKTVLGDRATVIAIDDGSLENPVDSSWIIAAGLKGKVLQLKRNMGHQRAIAIGLNYVAENLAPDYVVVMDSDGEDRPESILKLHEALESNQGDICVAVRKKRNETRSFKVFYKIYKRFFKFATGRFIDFGNFMVIKPKALKRLTAMSELWTHVAACVIASRMHITRVQINRGSRYSGQSKMNFVNLNLHGFRAMMVFVEDVLVRLGLLCVIIAALVTATIFVATLLKAVGYASPGWFSNLVLSLILIFLQTGAVTLMTLLTTGILKTISVHPPRYNSFVENISVTPCFNEHD